MGNGQEVSVAYIGMRCGEPQPIIAMKVGVARCRRLEGVIDFVNVRMYS